MITIWNYPLQKSFGDKALRQTVNMPQGGKVFSVVDKLNEETGEDEIRAYVIVDTEAPLVDHTFFVAGTGQDISEVVKEVTHPVGSVNTANDPLSWHVWHKPYGR